MTFLFLEGATGVVTGMTEVIGSIVTTAVLLAGLVVLVEIIIKIMSGDREAAKKLLFWLIGIAGGISVLRALINILPGA